MSHNAGSSRPTAGSSSSSRNPHTFGAPTASGELQSTFDESVTKEAQDYVDKFRKGLITRDKAEAAIDVILERGAANADISFTSDLSQPFLEQLDAHEQALRDAQEEGEKHETATIITPTAKSHSSTKRKRDDDSDSSSGEDSDEEAPRRRRKRIDKSKLTWEINSDTLELREPVRLVVSQLENFSRDPKEALRLLRASGSAPTFPTQSWKELLEGSYVDFDSINKDLFGGTTISTEEDWGRVWRVFEPAMSYAFARRGQELRTYGTYILDFFQQFKSDHHANVINFDRAVRHFIANSRDVLFSDTNRFTHLEISYLCPGGKHFIEPPSLRGPKRSFNNRTRSSDEVCRNWNNGNCSKGSDPCPGGRKHVCSTCGASDHRRKDRKQCPKPA